MTQRRQAVAAVLAVGAELVEGRVLERHAAWIARALRRLGIETIEHRSVGDTVSAIAEALGQLAAKARLIIVTGGLGPTVDDLTREGLAAWAGVPLEPSEAARRSILAWYAACGRTPGAGIERQARLPRGARSIANPVGTAPAIRLEHAGTIVYALPGVPHEMRTVWTRRIEAEIAERFAGATPVSTRTLRFFGVPESELDARIASLLPGGDPQFAFTVQPGGVELTLRAEAGPPARARVRLEEAVARLRAAFGEALVSDDGASLGEVVLRRLVARRLTIGFAESCTAGLATHLLAQVPGASAALRGSIIAYANAVKVRLLGVPPHLLERHGAVSEPVARAMARGALERLEVDLAVALTGIAGPSGARPDKPVGTVHIAVAVREGLALEPRHRRRRFNGDRVHVQQRAAWTALDEVRRTLAGGARRR